MVKSMLASGAMSRDNPGPDGEGGFESPQGRNQGFTIVEVIIAIVILAVGLLGLGGTTLVVVKQTTLADVTTERTAALQSTIERLKALPYDSVRSGADSIGAYAIRWTVTEAGQWKDLALVTEGPGMRRGAGLATLYPSVPDTFDYRIIRP
jgi:prepilin-type N-terminal cleavage/methylation domain-containing protein